MKSVGEEALKLSVQGLCCVLLVCGGETFALSVQDSMWWIDVLKSAGGEALALSVHGFCCVLLIF